MDRQIGRIVLDSSLVPKQRAIISIGYEGRTPREFLALLRANGVRKVIDVRELPLSRRKGFSKTPLSTLLETAGIAYQHLRAAGNPHRALKADTARCLALYAQHIAAHPEVVDLVTTGLAEKDPVAVICFERAHADCHRSRLLEAVDRKRPRAWRVVRVE